jgi:hypothetical protein
MGFIHSFGAAKQLLQGMKKGTCHGRCRTGWLRNIKYAMKTKSNPLKLTSEQKKELKAMIKDISGKRIQPKLRLGPSKSAVGRCGRKIRGKDGEMYISIQRKSSRLCKWVKYNRLTEEEKKEMKNMNKVSHKQIRPKGWLGPKKNPTRFCGMIRRGQDGKRYISVKEGNNKYCTWVKYKKYSSTLKNSKLEKSKSKSVKVTKKLTTEKSTISKKLRPSPTESATKLCGKRKRGNDGNIYLSKPNKNGVCRWVKVK